MSGAAPDISDEVLEEGCYYLSQLGLSEEQIAAHFETSREVVAKMASSYATKLKSGEVKPGEFDRTFWSDVKKEAEGDVKLTFLSEKGFHHGWRSELARLDGPALMSIFEASKDFLATDQNQKFLDYPIPKGFDPLALDREVRKALGVIEELLAQKWKEQSKESKTRPTTG